MQHRRFQQEMLDKMVLKATQSAQIGKSPFVLTGNIHPGSGKTLMALQAGDVLFKRDDIDTLVTLVPRRNLAAQTELSWKNNRYRFEPNALGYISHRENKWPLIRASESGYVTTYASLMANLALHQDQLKGRRVLLVLDEAQQLGADYPGGTGENSTASADQVQRLVNSVDVRGILIMSGTPFRADGNPLLLANYETRADGREYLMADVTASYSDGIEGEYLRLFDAHLYDGEVDWARANRASEKLTLSEYDRSLRPFLVESKDYWGGLVDRFVDHLNARQIVDRRFCGLIACYNQEQAAQVVAYLKQWHGGLRVLKAVSDDGEEAQRNLARFRSEQHDVLVTVQMAYIGYDQPFISVVLPLTGFREPGYLRQLLARSLRVVPGIPYDQQSAVWVVPADGRMKAFIEQERQELERGLLRRDERQVEESQMVQLPAQQDGWVTGGRITTQSVMGVYPEGDVRPDEFAFWDQLVADLKVNISPAYAKTLVMRYEQTRDTVFSPAPPPTEALKTQQECEREALAVLHHVIRQVTHQVTFFRGACQSKEDHGRAQRALRRHLSRVFTKRTTMLTLVEIEQQIGLVRSWLAEDCVPDAVMTLYRRLP